MGMQLGYTMMTEQAGPKDLVSHVVGAEEVGFDFAVSSDHFFPWLDEMGHSPNAWVTLGAAAQATSRIPLMTYVTCPSFRYHPAVVAQKAATLQILSDGRFTLGLGAGENLNEHVVGGGWPPADVRQEMLVEAIQIIRDLFDGDGYTNFRGEHFDVESAKLWDLPETRVPIGVAVSGKQSCQIAGELADPMLAAAARAPVSWPASGARSSPRRGGASTSTGPAAPASRGSARCRSASARTRLRPSPGRTRCSAGSASAGRSTPSCPARPRSTRRARSCARRTSSRRSRAGTTST